MKSFFIGIGKSALYISLYLSIQITAVLAILIGALGYVFAENIELIVTGDINFVNRIAEALENSAVYAIASDTVLILLLSSSLTILGFFIGYTILERNFFKRIDFSLKLKTGKAVSILLLGISMQFVVGLLINLMSSLPFYDGMMQKHEEVTGGLMNNNIILTFICVAVLVPITEEIVMRGLVYKKMKECSPRMFAIIFQAAVFGLIHGNLLQFLYATFLGIILASIYDWCGTLLAPILLHMSFNAFSTVISYLPVGKIQEIGSTEVLPYQAGLLGLLGIFIVIMILLFPVLMLYIRKGYNKRELKK